MSHRLIHLYVDPDHADRIAGKIREAEPRNWWRLPDTEDENERLARFTLVLHAARAQEILEILQEELADCAWRYVAVEAATVMPEPEDEEEAARLEDAETVASREEIYSGVRDDARLTRDYLVMIACATVIACIGLNTSMTAVVVGAMVIAPLLGPIMAFAFGTALGNTEMLRVSMRSLGAGIAVALAVAYAAGLMVEVDLDASIVDTAAPLGIGTVALPLASGVAAALMVSKGSTSALVGVMVAAALLPPLAAAGLLAGNGDWAAAGTAALTVAVNVVGINLACQAVFWLKGIRPDDWLSDGHPNSARWAVAGSLGMAALGVGLILLSRGAGGGGGLSLAGLF